MGGLIETEAIAKNRYATPETADIRLYRFNGCEGLTIGQLVNAVCCRIGAALEAQSVIKSNIITAETDRINAYAFILSGFMNGTVGYDTVLTTVGYEGWRVRDYLIAEGFTIGGTGEKSAGVLPADLGSVDNRLRAYDALKDRIDKLTNLSQQDMIDLQTDVSRRDVAFTTAVNAVRTFGGSLSTTASNL